MLSIEEAVVREEKEKSGITKLEETKFEECLNIVQNDTICERFPLAKMTTGI